MEARPLGVEVFTSVDGVDLGAGITKEKRKKHKKEI